MMKIFKNSLVALGLLLFAATGQQAHAQYAWYPVTVYVSQAEYSALDMNGSISVTMTSPTTFSGDGNMQMGPGPGPYQDPEPGDPCPEQHTPEIFQQMQQLANSTCQDVKFCLQSSDCVYYMYLVKPTAPNCIYYGVAPYQPGVAARRL